MEITVRLFAVLREAAGTERVRLSIGQPLTARAAFEALCREYPQLQKYQPILTFAVNGEYRSAETLLHDGDELALIPPISGGADG